MRKLLLAVMALGLIGCASQPKVVMRIVDPYSQVMYELTDAPCPMRGDFPFTFTYQGSLEGCYRLVEAESAIYFISSHDWSTQVRYTIWQLIEAKRAYDVRLGNTLQSVKPSYAPSVPVPSTPQPARPQPMVQCFSNNFGTVTCY